jgi:hypothetical protein
MAWSICLVSITLPENEMTRGFIKIIRLANLFRQKCCTAEFERFVPKGAPKYLIISPSLAIEHPVLLI